MDEKKSMERTVLRRLFTRKGNDFEELLQKNIIGAHLTAAYKRFCELSLKLQGLDEFILQSLMEQENVDEVVLESEYVSQDQYRSKFLWLETKYEEIKKHDKEIINLEVLEIKYPAEAHTKVKREGDITGDFVSDNELAISTILEVVTGADMEKSITKEEEFETIPYDYEITIINARSITYVQVDENEALQPMTPAFLFQPISQTDIRQRFMIRGLAMLVQRGKETLRKIYNMQLIPKYDQTVQELFTGIKCESTSDKFNLTSDSGSKERPPSKPPP